MAVDKFGIEIQAGDVLGLVQYDIMYMCVVDRGFTPQYAKVSILSGWGEMLVLQEKYKLKHLVVLSEEQIESISRLVVEERLRLQTLHGNYWIENGWLYSEEEMENKINELLNISREIKNQ